MWKKRFWDLFPILCFLCGAFFCYCLGNIQASKYWLRSSIVQKHGYALSRLSFLTEQDPDLLNIPKIRKAIKSEISSYEASKEKYDNAKVPFVQRKLKIDLLSWDLYEKSKNYLNKQLITRPPKGSPGHSAFEHSGETEH